MTRPCRSSSIVSFEPHFCTVSPTIWTFVVRWMSPRVDRRAAAGYELRSHMDQITWAGQGCRERIFRSLVPEAPGLLVNHQRLNRQFDARTECAPQKWDAVGHGLLPTAISSSAMPPSYRPELLLIHSSWLMWSCCNASGAETGTGASTQDAATV